MDIDAAIRENFVCDQKEWLEAMQLCIAALLRRGCRPALYDHETGAWKWTDWFTCPDEFGVGPEGIAAQPDSARLGDYAEHARRRHGHWPSSSEIGSAMLDRYR
jgi:transposase